MLAAHSEVIIPAKQYNLERFYPKYACQNYKFHWGSTHKYQDFHNKHLELQDNSSEHFNQVIQRLPAKLTSDYGFPQWRLTDSTVIPAGNQWGIFINLKKNIYIWKYSMPIMRFLNFKVRIMQLHSTEPALRPKSSMPTKLPNWASSICLHLVHIPPFLVEEGSADDSLCQRWT